MIKDLSNLIDSSEAFVRKSFLSEEQIFELIYQKLTTSVNTDNMYIALYDNEKEEVTFPIFMHNGANRKIPNRIIDKQKLGRTEDIILSKKPILIKTRSESINWYSQIGRQEYIGDHFSSWIGVPMLYEDKVLGVIAIYHLDMDNIFDVDDLKIIQMFANLSASALSIFRIKEKQHALEKELQYYINNKEQIANKDIQYNYKEVNYQIDKSIFINYAHEDGEQALKLSDELESYGLKVWIDKKSLKPGQRWRETILDSIQTSHYFIALLSNNSVNKVGFVQKEIGEALEIIKEYPPGAVYIIPVYLEKCSVQHRELKEFHQVDMYPDWDDGFKRLLKAFEK